MFLTFLVVAIFHLNRPLQGSNIQVQKTVSPQIPTLQVIQGSDVCIQACAEPQIQ